MGYDDLEQEAYLVFERVKISYPRVLEPKHFMSLFKRSLANAIFDQSRVYRKYQEVIDTSVVLENYDRVGEWGNDGELNALLASGPPELKLFVEAFKDDKCLEMLRKSTKSKGGHKENLNTKLARILGVEHYPFIQELKELLSQ